MILGTTELDVENTVSSDLRTRNILSQKSSIFQRKGKVIRPRTSEHASNVKFKQLRTILAHWLIVIFSVSE